jgi:hypothetical protein
MYAPAVSGIAHWDTSVGFDTFMKPFTSYGFRHAEIGAREVAIMQDIGWAIIPPPPAISGNTAVCSGHTYNFSASNWVSGFRWETSSNMRINGANTNSSVSITATGSGSGSVRIITGETDVVHEVWIDNVALNPAPYSVHLGIAPFNTSNQVCRNQVFTIRATAQQLPRGAEFQWFLYGWESYVVGYNDNPQGVPKGDVSLRLNDNAVSQQIVGVGLRNACSPPPGEIFLSMPLQTTNSIQRNNVIINGIHLFAIHCGAFMNADIYPNPVSDILNIYIQQEDVTTRISQIYELRLYNSYGVLVRQANISGNTTQFNVSNLPVGIYYLHIHDGINEQAEVKQIVVER